MPQLFEFEKSEQHNHKDVKSLLNPLVLLVQPLRKEGVKNLIHPYLELRYKDEK